MTAVTPTDADTLPPAVGADAALHAGRAARTSSCRRTASGSCSPAAAAAPTRSTASGCSTPRPARSASSPTRRCCSAAEPTTTTCRPRSGPAGSARARRRRDHRLRHRRRRHGRRVRPRRPAVRRRAAQRQRPASSPSTGRCSTPGPIRWPSASPTSAGGAVRRRARRALARARRRRATSPRRSLGQRRVRRRRGDGPVPRATGGAPTARRSPSPGSTPRRCSGGTSATRPIPAAAAHRGRLPRGRHGQRRRHRCTSCASTGRTSTSSGTATRSRTSPTCAGPTPALILTVQSRDQRAVEVLEVDPATGATDRRWRRHRRRLGRARARRAALGPRRRARHVRRPRRRPPAARRRRAGDARRPAGARRRRRSTGRHRVPRQPDRRRHRAARLAAGRRDGELEALTDEPGVHAVAAGGGTVVVRTATLDEPRRAVGDARRHRADVARRDARSCAPNVRCRSRRRAAAGHGRAAAPTTTTARPLPVLLDPYGGPHAQRVVRPHNAYLTSQWFADQGFAVVVVDGRGTPGRGSEWERAVHLDLATAVLDDQVDALAARPPSEHGARPRPGRDPRLELRRLPRRARRAAPARRVPRRRRRRAGHRVAALRHALHRALPRRSDEQPEAYDASSLLPAGRRS